jgi:hypothetical protein
MTQSFCPYLGTRDDDDTRGPAQDYPSFENHCFAIDLLAPNLDELASGDQLLLTDQATYCLGSSHRLCPRFRMLPFARNDEDEYIQVDDPSEQEETAYSPYVNPARLDDLAYEDDSAQGPRLGIWIGVASIFFVFLLCGGSLAAYAGWQIVGRGWVPFGDRLVQRAEEPQQNQVFLLVTPTPFLLAQTSTLPTVMPTPTPNFDFPRAVTPTPTSGEAPAAPVVITTPTPAAPVQTENEGEAPSDPALATAVAGAIVITTPGDLSVPTRRPTPTFAVPTSTPGEPAVVVVTATPTPVYPDPIIEFRSAHNAVIPGDCTTLFWKVENVRAVFLDNEGVFGQGERRVCPRWGAETYTLSVLRMEGTQEEHKVTVNIQLLTPTPTPTPSYTPVLTPTPTWTPEGGAAVTSTPQPPPGVALTVDGGNQRTCVAGQRCEIILQAANTGPLADEIFIDLANSGPWRVEICRGDGICGETTISLGVGPGSQLPIYLRVDIPADAAGQAQSYPMVGTSGNSNRSVRSEVVVTLNVQ